MAKKVSDLNKEAILKDRSKLMELAAEATAIAERMEMLVDFELSEDEEEEEAEDDSQEEDISKPKKGSKDNAKKAILMAIKKGKK